MILAEGYWHGDDHLSQGDRQWPNDRCGHLGGVGGAGEVVGDYGRVHTTHQSRV
jgi:hypothetical protein